jgi:hypothetical protein
VLKHREGVLRPGASGRVGRRVLPYLTVFGGLSVLGPLVDAVAVFAVLTSRLDVLVALWSILMAAVVGSTMLAFALDGQPVRRAWVAPLAILVYRPFSYMAHIRALQHLALRLRPSWRAPAEVTPHPTPCAAAIDLRRRGAA